MKSKYSVRVSSFLAAAALLGALTLQGQTSGSQKTLTGVVSDSMCGANHMAKDMPSADCLRMCVKKGTKVRGAKSQPYGNCERSDGNSPICNTCEIGTEPLRWLLQSYWVGPSLRSKGGPRNGCKISDLLHR